MRLGPFVVEELVGHGAMGQVWRARHEVQRLPVAVKVITAERARSTVAKRAFAQEVQAMARLAHPHIVTVLDTAEVSPDAAYASGGRLVAGSPYFVMELAARSLMDVAPDLTSFAEVRQILLDLLDALAHAHARGVIHRDIKPLNVLGFREAESERFKLADFGVAHAFRGAGRDDRGASSGTPRYMAPEQVVGSLADQGPWTDLYALGCLAFLLMSGAGPFEGPLARVMRAHLEAAPPPVVGRFGLPEGIDGWLGRLLAKHPADRYRFAADAAHDLRALPAPPATERIRPWPGPASGLGGDDATRVVGGGVEEAPLTATSLSRPRPAPMVSDWTPGTGTRASILGTRFLGAGLGLYHLRPVPMVGRRQERDHLWRLLAQVHEDGRPRAVVVAGPSGVGKSRLVEWLTERAQELGAAEVLTATHGPVASPGDGVVAAIQRHLRAEGLGEDERLERLYRQLSDHGREPQVNLIDLRLLGELLAGGGHHASEEERQRATARYLTSSARVRPLILWLDDAQWGFESLGLCGRLLDEERGNVLVVLTVRHEALAERPLEAERLEQLASRDEVSELTLPPLPDDEHAELVDGLVGLEGAEHEEVLERTRGNPLFAVQLVGDWVERGVLKAGEVGFRRVAGAQAPLPDGIHTVWSQRVERLLQRLDAPDAGRLTLEIAATLGPVLDQEEWEAVCQHRGVEAPDGLGRALERARLAWPRFEQGGTKWGFAHGMLRESITRGAEEAGRLRAHHRACAEVLERAGQGGPHHERVAAHWVASGELERALAPLLEAAEYHSKRGDFLRALAVDDRRDRAVQELGLADDDPLVVVGICRRVRTLCMQGDYDIARERVTKAAAAATSRGDDPATMAELRWTQAVFARHDNDLDQGVAWLEEALRLFGDLGDERGRARCHKKLGELLRIRGRLNEAAGHYATALAAFERLDDPYEIAWSLMGLGSTQRQMGNLEGAERWSRRGLGSFERMGGRLGIGHAHNELGEIARFRGDHDGAIAHYEEVLVAWGGEAHRDLDLVRYNLGLAHLGRGDVAEAQTTMLSLERRASERGRKALLLFVTTGLCAAAAAAGDFATCESRAEVLGPMLEALPLVDLDIASSLRLAGDHARRAGHDELAKKLHAWGRAQYLALGDETAAAALA